jgi:hypothetical protein
MPLLKKQIKLSLDLTYEILKETSYILEVLRDRNSIYRNIIETDLKRYRNIPCNNINYENCNYDLNEDFKKGCNEG